jgi:tetratricopeptide (TPR) repeat protein
MTTGVFTPKILLPPAWRDWPTEILEAVLLHERAHVARRDTAVAVLARINTCIFWFHPLAWVLERTLSATAEYACDAAAVKALGTRERYAEILVSMAWQRVPGLGFGGVGLLEKRVDRVLGYSFTDSISRWRKAVLMGGCAAAILASCVRAVAPLQENPKLAEFEKRRTILRMTPAEVEELEAIVKKKPEDLNARGKLIEFYTASGDQVLGWEKATPARRAHILWLIANHPDHKSAGSQIVQLKDPPGFEEAKFRWLELLNQPSVQPAVLANAASFFSVTDRVFAEDLLLRAQAMDPRNEWSSRLGQLYYEVLVGSNALMPGGIVRSVNPTDAHSPHAVAVRAKLAVSKDKALLFTTGIQLLLHAGAGSQVDFDTAALAYSYLERTTLASGSFDVMSNWRELHFQFPGQESYEAIATLPDNKRLASLGRLAEYSYMRGEIGNARKAASEALALAPSKREDPFYSKAVYSANMVSGLLAMQDGDRPRALRHLQAAVEVPASRHLAHAFDSVTFKLAGWLLKDGERETVIAFLERLAAMPHSQQAYLLESAQAIRKGVKPLFYPR